MTDFLAAVSSGVRFCGKGRVVLPPQPFGANLGGFRGGFGMSLWQGWEWNEGMIVMQEKGLMPLRAA